MTDWAKSYPRKTLGQEFTDNLMPFEDPSNIKAAIINLPAFYIYKLSIRMY